jgi:phosphonate transport system substrate-binding protein
MKFICMVCAWLLALTVQAACLGDPQASKTYFFDVVPQYNASKIYSTWAPVLQRVGKEAGLCFDLRVAANIPDFEHVLLRGDAQFAFVNPYHAVLAFQKKKYAPLLADGHELLTGILVIRKDSGIASVEALKGKAVAFPAPNAFAASLLIRAELARKQVVIQPVFVKNHSNVYRAVIAGDMKAGGGVNNTLNSEAPEIQDKLMVLYETQAYSPHPVVTHPSIPSAVRAKFLKAMLSLTQEAEGQKLLDGININQPKAVNFAQHYKVLESLKLEKFLVLSNP